MFRIVRARGNRGRPMSFNSFPFFGFLAVVMIGFVLLGAGGRRGPQLVWLIGWSIGYYGLVFVFDRGLAGWQPMLVWFAWLLGAVIVNDIVGSLLRRHPAAWLLILGIAINVGMLWAYKFNLHPLYYGLAIIVAGGNGLVWAWMSGGGPGTRAWFRLAGMVTVNLSLWGWLAIAAVSWAWLAGRPATAIDPFGITGPLTHNIADGGPTAAQIAVLLAVPLFPPLLALCWLRRGVRWPAILGGLVGTMTVAIATAFAAVASLYGISWIDPVPLRLMDINLALGAPVSPILTGIMLPLGLSFMMLQHIGFLVDCRAGRVENHTPLTFGMFTLFFAQLPAGPILKWQELEPQLRPTVPRPDHGTNIRIGVALIALGLFKKVVIADNLDGPVDALFADAGRGDGLHLLEAWAAAIGFTLQLYFDLSGYADMAIGTARLFGIRLPMNFNAPLRAPSVMDFWRRWHTTLTRWFFDHIQRPMARWRPGADWRAYTVVIAMVAMGLWHDVAWTFLLWGALHGAFLTLNVGWTRLRRAAGAGGEIRNRAWRLPMVLLTFAVISFSFVPFRADDLDMALDVMVAMIGAGPVAIPFGVWSWFDPSTQTAVLDAGIAVTGIRHIGPLEAVAGLALLLFVWFFPSSTDLLRKANDLAGVDDPLPDPPAGGAGGERLRPTGDDALPPARREHADRGGGAVP